MSSDGSDERAETQPDAAIPFAEPVPVVILGPADEAGPGDTPDPGGGADDSPAPLPYERPDRKLVVAPYVLEGSTARHFVFPLVLIVAGTVMLYASLARDAGPGPAFARAAAHRSVYVTIVVLLSLGVAAGCARVLDVTFGLLTPAVVKLTAVVVFPMAAGTLIASAFGNPGAPVTAGAAEAMGMIFGLPLMWLLFLYLFQMEGRESVICLAALSTLRMVAAIGYAVQ